MVADIIYREEAAQRAGDADENTTRPDDTDYPEQKESDMRAWAVREMRRIKAYVGTGWLIGPYFCVRLCTFVE